MALLAVNILFICFFGCYKPAKSRLTNKVVFVLEVGLLIIAGLFIAYDKTIDKSITTQQGYSIALVVVQILMIVIALIWSFYRLLLVIR